MSSPQPIRRITRGLRPYLFRVDVRPVPPRARSDKSHNLQIDIEADVIHEQRWAIFSLDPTVQTLFHGDFENFCTALDNPGLLGEQLAQMRAPESSGPFPFASFSEEMRARESPLDDDPVYEHAFRWACRAERWSRRFYELTAQSDSDLFRVAANALLVPVKVAVGFVTASRGDRAGIEISAINYRQASFFLHRILDALGRCDARRVGRSQTAHRLMDGGRELLADVESRIAELEAEMRSRGWR